MNASSEVGPGDGAPESVPTETEKQQPNSFVNALLADARDMGHVIGEPTRTQTESGPVKEVQEPPPAEEEEEEPVTEPEPKEVEQEEEPEEDSAGKAEPSIEQQLQDYAAKGQKPPWYLGRIAKQTQKIETRTKERDDAVALSRKLSDENQALRQQLEGAERPMSDNNPAINCWNENDFESLTRECKRAIIWATKNPMGGDYVKWKTPAGEDVVQSFDEEGAQNFKLNAEETLRDGIPAQRKYLEAQEGWNQEAAKIYPEFKDPKSAMSQEAALRLQEVPWLKLIPDIKVWLGHALVGKAQYFAKLNGRVANPTRERIAQSARTKVAPIIPRSRGVIRTTRGAGVETALKTLQQKGDAESAEKWLEARDEEKARSTRIERMQ